MKKALILAAPNFQDIELLYPKIRLTEAGIKVTVAGLGEDSYKGKYGYPVDCDADIKNVRPLEYDAIIIPGGWAPDHIRQSKAALNAVKTLHKKGRVVAAICHGGWVLASAGIIKGKAVTSYIAIKDDMINAGAHWTDKEVVVDQNIITSRKPDDLPAFMKAILKQLNAK
ncbi:Intracellular protease 1 [uncultured archaeon]|nr:Intracellular protease 1 [uncultured archaeon]